MNKRKVLDAARKHAQKGAKQKALKEYDKLLAADPRDAKLLLEVGDAYRRWGQVEEAIAQYTKVAGQFRQDGFDARAVAVYKQILNLDSKRYETYVSLGELYQHMGLDAEAIGSLQTAADGYHKEGNKPKALELLRKMAALDPSNTTSRMKVADLLKQEGLNGDASAEYAEVAAELQRQGANDAVPPVLERMLEIDPESASVLAQLIDCNLELDRADRAEMHAVKLVELAPDADNLERLLTIYRKLGDDEKLASTTRDLAKLYRDRGDEDQAREIMQRLPSAAVGGVAGLGQDQSELEEPSLSDDDLLDDDEFLLGDDGDDEIDLGGDIGGAPKPEAAVAPKPAAAPEPDASEESAAPLEVPDGDPEQLFAEASVYLRYGKIEPAIASLKGILLQEPDHRGALEKLGEAVAEKDDTAGAVANWRRAAELAAEQGDAAGLDLLRDRIHALDPDAASALPTLDAAPAAPAAPVEDSADDELELELDLDTEVADEASGDDTEGLEFDLDDEVEVDVGADAEAQEGETAGIELDLDDDAFEFDVDVDGADDEDDAETEADAAGFEIDIDADDDLASALADASGDDPGEADANEATSGFQIDLDDAGDIDIDIDVEAPDIAAADDGIDLAAAELDIDLGDDDSAESAPAAASNNEQSNTAAARIEGELEEAEFYLKQELPDEAEAIYRRILEIAPGHPGALLRLGEISASKGASPSTASEPAAAAPADSDGEFVQDAALDIGLDDEDHTAPEAASEAVADDSALDLDGAFDDETEDSTEVAMLDDAAMAATGAPANPLLAEDLADAALAQAEPAVDVTQPLEPIEAVEPAPQATPAPLAAASEADAGESFDLAAELAGAFEEANAPDEPEATDNGETGSVLSKVDDGFESIFSDFKKGVSASLEEGDYETRYDLGIAYREMGLYEDAIAEFRVCLDSTHRRLESLHMMGLSALDLGRSADAVNHLEQALATADLPEDRKVGVYFDLGRAHEASGDPGRAEGVYLEVQALDTSFPGVAERLEAVRNGDGAAPVELASETEGGLENFDDLFSDDAEEAPEAPAEAFESFDDVITAVDEEDDVEDAVMEAEPIEETAEEEPPTDPGTSGRRKKKISFV